MKKIISFVFILAACNNIEKKVSIPNTNINVINNKDTLIKDTSKLGMRISQNAYDKMEKLKNADRKAYARTILKQYAFCNCMLSVSQNDSVYLSEDVSSMILSRDFVIHKHDIVDSINKLVTEYLLPPTTVKDSEHRFKNQSLRCLNLYTSEYLDSVVKSYDKEIIIENR